MKKSLAKNTEQNLEEQQNGGGLPSLEEIVFDTMGLDKKSTKVMAEQMSKHGFDGVVDGSFLESTVHPNHQSHVKILRIRLKNEYTAQTATELMLIDMAINSYMRHMHASQVYSNMLMDRGGQTSFNQLRVNMLKELTKQIEAANHQFMASITMLKELKRPPINVKVHSKQAFIAQNQQFNKNA
ncbi:hypothetical protein C5B42_00700 [Candidatus Cerribacteria bacterium 'Amazon FNV 2010 28 9']|uniref:Uncharacterized protein n=1 Tax=Candidatus Cerribacteria bacterium 'Amazon FNV 2010 28 9' TaxID=2081795 RepID=A0A317JQV7_9BACT|nr:MAG: hypothetical protein C5B42_00700 [Candidatus Cerribacteria bacterium 'Amazon FNV 2010 28 9']